MKKILLFVFALILTACLPSSEGIPQAAVTSTPPPTITPIPTIPPQFLALQEQIAQSDTYTLNADGQIEMQTPDGMTIVPGILVSKDGKMTVTHEGEEFEADPTTIKIDGQILTFQDKEGKTWVWDGKELKIGFEAYKIGKETVVNTEYKGVAVSVSLIVDQTALDVKVKSGGKEISLDNIVLNPDFINKYGEKSEEALGHAILYAQWRAWQENIDDALKTERKNVSFDKWVGMVKTAQETNLPEDWDKVIFQASANDLTTEKYDPEYRDFKPGGNIKIVYTNADFKNLGVEIENVSTGLRLGTGVAIDGTLTLFYGNYPKIAIYGKGDGVNKDMATTHTTSRLLFRVSMQHQGSNVGTDWNVFIRTSRKNMDIYKILANANEGSNVALHMITITK